MENYEQIMRYENISICPLSFRCCVWQPRSQGPFSTYPGTPVFPFLQKPTTFDKIWFVLISICSVSN